MGFKHFSVLIMLRTSLVMANLALLALLFSLPGYHAATFVSAVILVAQCIELTQFVSRTNAELVRFFDAARYADYSQRFDLNALGSGFGELGAAFSDILDRFRVARAGSEEELRHLKAIVEHVPVPLLSIRNNKEITLWNNAARRLFGTNSVTQLSDLNKFGDTFANQLNNIKVGERKLVSFQVDDMELQLSISATQVLLPGSQDILISLQDIQSELDSTQLQAWQELVSVLTHEIMNSITPIASLANTAADLVEDAKQKIVGHPDLVEELSDALDAVNTVARRSEGLTKFVGSYRRLNKLAAPVKKQIAIQQLFDHIIPLATQTKTNSRLTLTSHVLPKELEVYADAEMLEQVLLNLLQNAEHAVSEQDSPAVSLSAYMNKRGHVVIEVCDNGHGISPSQAKQIFVPFYTTKREGSGVGLALTRQVMLAHQGKVKVENSESGGCVFSLTF